MYVHVQVTPGVRRERVIKKDATSFIIEVKEPKERNLANKRVREILAAEFSVTTSQITMLTGHRSPSKMFSIEVV
ncbi:MAG: DUF167 family protein [Candidatus Pacebacteria bacterium]|nr:DUF167 family protein [Candidatus Paceibacterota bacterium]MCF7857170.1 DUF167 family protein [Candidatus Paceibacterota bacterium]